MAADGRIIVTGGVIGWDVTGHLPEGFIPQVKQTLENIAAILAEGGAGPTHLVRLTWYVVDMEEYLANLKVLGRIYRDVFGPHYPAMALVQVVRLVEKAARVEVEGTAVVPQKKLPPQLDRHASRCAFIRVGQRELLMNSPTRVIGFVNIAHFIDHY